MSFRVSVRDLELLDQSYRAERRVPMTGETAYNSRVLQEILKHAPRILPVFAGLNKEDTKNLADGVAYLLRTDIIIAGEPLIVAPNFHGGEMRPTIYREDGRITHLVNDPNQLSPDFKLPVEYMGMASEYFRCYVGTLDLMKDVLVKLDPRQPPNCFSPSFSLAELTAYLLDPTDLVDYKYTKEELGKFNAYLDKQSMEV